MILTYNPATFSTVFVYEPEWNAEDRKASGEMIYGLSPLWIDVTVQLKFIAAN